MSRAESRKTDKTADYWARGGALAGIILSIVTFWYQNCRGPKLVGTAARYIQVTPWPRVGIPVGLYNSGPAAGLINSGYMDLQGPHGNARFSLALSAPTVETSVVDDQGKPKSSPAAPSLFTQLPVKGGDVAQAVFWFNPSPGQPFAFDPGCYSGVITFVNRSEEAPLAAGISTTGTQLCRVAIRFKISDKVAQVLLTDKEKDSRYPIEASCD
jgi:hypothetical protein